MILCQLYVSEPDSWPDRAVRPDLAGVAGRSWVSVSRYWREHVLARQNEVFFAPPLDIVCKCVADCAGRSEQPCIVDQVSESCLYLALRLALPLCLTVACSGRSIFQLGTNSNVYRRAVPLRRAGNRLFRMGYNGFCVTYLSTHSASEARSANMGGGESSWG